MKKLFTVVLAGLVLGVASVAFSATLVDVPSGHWAEDAVTKLVNSGLIEGYPDGTYKGERPMTRYEYAMVIARLVDKLDKTYCTKEDCKPGAAVAAAPSISGGGDIDTAQLDEVKAIVKKLAAEFKDELAALKVKVDENSVKIAELEKKVNTPMIGKIKVGGSIRQRIDAPQSDLKNADFLYSYNAMYNPTDLTRSGLLGAGFSGLAAGYEMVPSLVFSGSAGDDVTFSIGLDKYINNDSMIGSLNNQQELDIQHAFVDIDFTKTVRELDALKVRSGYQQVWFGPYGMLVDNTGLQSTPGVKAEIAKDFVSIAAFGSLAEGNTTPTVGLGNPAAASIEGLGSTGKDPYAAARLGLDLSFVDVGVNVLINGVDQEKGWGADLVVPVLKNSPFLKEFRGEYLKITDLANGNSVASGDDDSSFVVGLDLYKNKKAGLTLSYADIPAIPVLTSADANPFTEYDTVCPLGLDIDGSRTGQCFSYASGRMLFPAGFEGIGVEASYIVFGDVELGGKAVLGNFAGGSYENDAHDIMNLDGHKYPGFGAVSVTKPINSDSKFRVEYMQQGRDPILLDRVRGELLINF